MHVRVVRFTDVPRERFEGLQSRVDAEEGPPQDVPITGIQILFDEQQRTAVVIQQFATAEDMRAAETYFDTMDPGETPGTRASVDRCEMKVELRR